MKLHDSQFKIGLIFLLSCLGAASQFILQSLKVNFLLIGCFSERVDIMSRQVSSYSYTIDYLSLSPYRAESRKNCLKAVSESLKPELWTHSRYLYIC